MTGRLLAQLGWVFWDEAERHFGDPYAAMPKIPTDDETREGERLRDIADELFERAAAAGQLHNGIDDVFGKEDQRP